MSVTLIDIHSHTCRPGVLCSIDVTQETPPADGFFSAGIHPWSAGRASQEHYRFIKNLHKANPNMVAVGECGLDALRGPSADIQFQVFKSQALLAEELHLPVIIHAVKSYNEIMQVYREVNPSQPWLVHGFRKGPEPASQLRSAGLEISFGEHFNEQALLATPLDRLFLESDTADSFEQILQSAATLLSLSIENLVQILEGNIRRFLQF